MPTPKEERLMKLLGVTAEEASEICRYDTAVDNGERTPYDLTAEQEKIAKAYKNVDSHEKSTSTGAKKRNVPENAQKEAIIALLTNFLSENYENVAILNKTRQIGFKIGTKSYELTLVEKRK